MLEGLWLREEQENKLLWIFVFGLVFTLISAGAAELVFPSFTGLVTVFLVSLMGAYPMITYLRDKENEEMKKKICEEKMLKRHEDELAVYLSFFLGVTLGFVIAGYFMPSGFFQAQEQVILSIRGSLTANIVSNSFFQMIISNNLWVFFLTFLLSFLFSAGMIFILVWNASVLGIFLARASENITHFHLLAISYLPHGLMEIAAYTIAGIAGALISYQFDYYFIRKEPYDIDPVIRVIKDVMVLMLIGLVLLIVAGAIEVI